MYTKLNIALSCKSILSGMWHNLDKLLLLWKMMGQDLNTCF